MLLNRIPKKKAGLPSRLIPLCKTVRNGEKVDILNKSHVISSKFFFICKKYEKLVKGLLMGGKRINKDCARVNSGARGLAVKLLANKQYRF